MTDIQRYRILRTAPILSNAGGRLTPTTAVSLAPLECLAVAGERTVSTESRIASRSARSSVKCCTHCSRGTSYGKARQALREELIESSGGDLPSIAVSQAHRPFPDQKPLEPPGLAEREAHHDRCLLQRDGALQDPGQHLGSSLFSRGHRHRVLSHGRTESLMA